MGGLAAILLLGGVSEASAQSKKFMPERRIFLWDVTISMVGATSDTKYPLATPRKNPDFKYDTYVSRNGKSVPVNRYNEDEDIFDETRQNLCDLIDKIGREDTEIVVVPYTDGIQFPAFRVYGSTSEDKNAVKKQIMEWNKLRAGQTLTGACLQNVIDTFFSPDKVNRVVLLTDGNPSTAEDKSKLYNIVRGWDQTIGGTTYFNNRLVYAMLTPAAQDEEMKALIDTKNQYYDSGVSYIESLDDLPEYVSFSIRNTDHKVFINNETKFNSEGYIEVGCELNDGVGLDAVTCSFTCDYNDYISLVNADSVKPINGKFRIYYKFIGDDRGYYLQKGTGAVNIRCEVDKSCKNVVLEDANNIHVEFETKPVPRVTISMSTK